MKHSGKASLAALKLVGSPRAAVLVLLVAALLGKYIGAFVLELSGVLFVSLWILFALFTFYFFRDPDPMTPTGANLVIAPGHGKVDVIDTTTETEFHGRRMPAHLHFSFRVRHSRAKRASDWNASPFSNTRPASISTR